MDARNQTRILICLALVLLATPVLAETFTVEMANGTEFTSRYRPQQASWDSDMVMILTDYGNWIALRRSDIQIVTADTEIRGFGKVIDTTTIDLGIAPNDLPPPDPEGAQPSQLEMLQNILQQQPPPQSYDVPQFVSPGQAGQGGLPVGFAAGTGGRGGGGTSVINLGGGGN